MALHVAGQHSLHVARRPYHKLRLKANGKKVSLRIFADMLLEENIGTFPRKIRKTNKKTKGGTPINSGRLLQWLRGADGLGES